MAGANYEVNIQLKADPALKSLERIEQKINALTKTSVDLQDAKGAAMVKNRNLGDQINKLEEKGVKVTQLRERLGKSVAATDKLKFLTAKAHIDILDDEIKAELQILNLKKQQQAVDNFGGGKKGKFGSAVSSALIGGAFPLLFGQGGLSAAGGAIGGLAGLIGEQFGFAGSLIGTALGTAIQEAEDFNRELVSLNSNLVLSGDASVTTAGDIRSLASELNIASEEAADLIKSFSLFGDGNVREELARVFGPVGGLEAAEAIVKARLGEKDALESISALAPTITLEQAQQVSKLLEAQGALAASAALQEAILAISQEDTREKEKQVGFMDRMVSALSFLAAGMAGPAGLGLPESPLAPQGAAEIAEERAAAVEAPDMALIEPALKRLEEFYKNRNRLEEKYGKSTSSNTNKAEALAQSLSKQLARYEEIDPMARKIAMIEADHLVNLERIAGVKDEGKRQQLEVLAEKLKEAKINDLLVSQDEKRAEEQRRYIESFNQRLFSADAEGRILQATLEGRGDEQRLIEKINKATEGLEPKEAALLEQRLRSNDALRKQGEEVAKLQQIYDSLGSTIANGVVGMLDAAFDRTKSLADAAGNLLKNLANQLLQLGVNTLLSSTGISLFKNLPGFADGGTIMGGQAAIVGEKGPEVFVPGKTGTVIPNHALGGANIVVNVDAKGTQAQGNQPNSAALGRAIGAAVQAELIKQKRPGGLLA